MILHVDVVNKIATYQKRGGSIVCGNSDYQIQFTFDSEWSEYTTKTARFIWNGSFIDVSFTNNTCTVPPIYDTDELEVGVYAGNLKTTTSAFIGCYRSILCDNVTPSKDSDRFYASEAKYAATDAIEAADKAEGANARAEAAAKRSECAADNVVTLKGINQTSPSGLVDTYEVELTNGDKYPFYVTNGKNGTTPVKNQDYFDGYTPQLNVDYFDGVGIKEIAKVQSEGLVDTYEITFTGGRTPLEPFRFTVTNGRNADSGGDEPEEVYEYMKASLSVEPSSVEYADKVTVKITWSVSEAAEYITLTLPDGKTTVDLTSETSPYTDPNEYVVTSGLTWKLDAKRDGGKGETVPTKTANLFYKYLVYLGVGNKENYNEPAFMKEFNEDYDIGFLSSLQSEQTTLKGRTLRFTSIDSQYIYYAIPENLCKNSDGTISEPIFQIGEFPYPGGVKKVKELTIEKNGVSIVYYLYRTYNLLVNDAAFNVYVK